LDKNVFASSFPRKKITRSKIFSPFRIDLFRGDAAPLAILGDYARGMLLFRFAHI
jgi:hypothetical protein